MDPKETHTEHQRSNCEQLEVNRKSFNFKNETNISIQEDVKKSNDNRNTSLHLGSEKNELEVANQGADTNIENGNGRTPLQLAEECNDVETINAPKSFTSQVKCPPSETDRLPSHTSQRVASNPNKVSVFHSNSHAAATGKQTASTVLPYFSGALKVDKELKLSHDNFKQSIRKFYSNKQLSTIDQLKATPPYPTPHVLAQFANMAYLDCKRGGPKPPNG